MNKVHLPAPPRKALPRLRQAISVKRLTAIVILATAVVQLLRELRLL